MFTRYEQDSIIFINPSLVMGSCFGTSNRRGYPSELDGPDGSGKRPVVCKLNIFTRE